jgi:uncharacterized protein YkwD
MFHPRSTVPKVAAIVVSCCAALTLAVVAPPTPAAHAAATPDNTDQFVAWVNYYRMMSGVPKVSDNTNFQNGARRHSCYMLQNGLTHAEDPAKPGYTVEGDRAGRNGNVAVHSVANTPVGEFTDLWMTAPFHALGMLRPGLRQIGSGRCDIAEPYPGQKWRSAATVDILSGLDTSVKVTAPIVFPGNGATVRVSRFIAETPDPRTFCGWSGATVGLPLVAQLPESSLGAVASMSGPAGPVKVCTLTNRNTSGVAQALLSTNNVIVVPDAPLQAGTYRATVKTSYRTLTWSFTVNPNGGGPDPSTTPIGSPVAFTPVTPTRVVDTRVAQGLTRLSAGVAQRLQLTGTAGVPTGSTAAAVNIAAVSPSGSGYLTVYPCGALPVASSLNYVAGEVVGNGVVVPLDARGGLCVFSSQSTDVIVDLTGFFSAGSTSRFNPVVPTRVLDTRSGFGGSVRVPAGGTIAVTISGVAGVPTGAPAAAVNITAVSPSGPGFLTAYPCGAARPASSTINYTGGAVRANNALVALGGGKLCLFSSQATDVVVDLTGFFASSGRLFQAVQPVRVVDTRLSHYTISAGQMGQVVQAGQHVNQSLAGRFGLPSNAAAVAANVIAVQPRAAGYLTAYPPQNTPPNAATLNYVAGSTVANGSHTILGSGSLRVFTSAATHVVVDLYGVWV